MDIAKEIALTHHEKWYSTRYTRALARGLGLEGIPLAGLIVAIAHVFNALTAGRP